MSETKPPSSGGTPSLPTQEERLAMRLVGATDDGGELDRERADARLAAGRLYEVVGDAVRKLGIALTEQDDHLLVESCRRLLAQGLVCKGIADKMERALPQPTRLFDPAAR